MWLLETALPLDSKKISLVKQMECTDAMRNYIGMELGCKWEVIVHILVSNFQIYLMSRILALIIVIIIKLGFIVSFLFFKAVCQFF